MWSERFGLYCLKLMLPSFVQGRHLVPCLCKNLLLFCCRTHECQKNTEAWHFSFIPDIYKGTTKHSRCVDHERLVSKNVFRLNCHSATINLVSFLCDSTVSPLLPRFLAPNYWIYCQRLRRERYRCHDAPAFLMTGPRTRDNSASLVHLFVMSARYV